MMKVTNQNTAGGGEIVKLQKGKETDYQNSKISFDKFDISSETMADMQAGKDFQMGAVLTIENAGKVEEFELFRKSVSGEVIFTDYTSENAGIKIQLTNLTAEMIEVSISSLNETQQQVV